jgi:hypothetical protein
VQTLYLVGFPSTHTLVPGKQTFSTDWNWQPKNASPDNEKINNARISHLGFQLQEL